MRRLEVQCQVEEFLGALEVVRTAHVARDLIEDRFRERRDGPEDAAVGFAASFQADAHPEFRANGADVIQHVSGVEVDRDEQVRDEEPWSVHVAGLESFVLEPVAPEFAWDVGHDAASVALAAHLAAAVRHLRQCLECAFDIAVGGRAGLAHGGDDAAGVVSDGFVQGVGDRLLQTATL